MVARNYRARSGAGEIDLVAWDGDALAFVEVKTRSSEEYGAPEAAVDALKLGANAVVGLRYDATEVGGISATEVLCYGTAVVIEPVTGGI